MKRPLSVLLSVSAALLGSAGLGCQVEGVGDPCVPEAVPASGFDDREAYLETSSVQCRTRVCMVYRLDGDPNQITGEPSCATTGEDSQCVAQSEVDARVYCTCRCNAPDDPTATPCECPDGYTCKEILKLGGPGITGSYCVRSSTIDAA